MQSVRAFSAAHLRSRSTVSPWERQTAKLSASSSAMAAAAAWTTAVQHQEAHQASLGRGLADAAWKNVPLSQGPPEDAESCDSVPNLLVICALRLCGSGLRTAEAF